MQGRKLLQLRLYGTKLGEQEVASIAQQSCIGEVVDVLGGAAHVHEFKHLGRGACRSQLIANVVLDCFHVVVGSLFDRLDGRSRCGGRRFGEFDGDIA